MKSGVLGVSTSLPVLAMMMLVSGHALAIPVNYMESSSGDLSFPGSAFVLAAGTNTVSGTTHLNLNSPGRPRFDSDFDGLGFEVPIGTELVGITLSFLTMAFNVDGASIGLGLCAGTSACTSAMPGFVGEGAVNLLDTVSATLDFALPFPLAAGAFSFFTSSLGIIVDDPTVPQANWSSDYTWTFRVRSVDEPDALALLVLGFTGLLVMRCYAPSRRRERSSTHPT